MPTDNLTIRAFAPGDAAALSELINRNLQAVLVHDFGPAVIAALIPFFTPEKLIAEAAEQFALVAWNGGALAGTAWLAGDRVRTVFVDPGQHRRGIGRRLMAGIEAQARAAGQARIYLMATPYAIAFYEALGFRVVERFDRDLAGLVVPEAHMEKVLAANQL